MRIGDHRPGSSGKAPRPLPILLLGWILAVQPVVTGAEANTVGAADSFAQTLVQTSTSHLIGQQAPRLSFTTIDGKRLDLSDIYGHEAVYLEFWATWCVPCLQQVPHLIQTYRRAGTRLFVVAVNTGFNETLPAVLAYRRKMGLQMPIVIDEGRFARAFGLRATPQHVVIDRAGRISYIGHLADAQLDRAILAAETSPPAARPAMDAPKVATGDGASYGVGQQVPDRFVQSIGNGRIRLFDPKSGQRTILYFFSPWCETYFRATRPAMAAACHAATGWVADRRARDHHIIAIASGLWITARDVADYRAHNRMTSPMVLDARGSLFREFRIQAVPAFVVIDSSGGIVSMGQGDRAMAALSAGGQS